MPTSKNLPILLQCLTRSARFRRVPETYRRKSTERLIKKQIEIRTQTEGFIRERHPAGYGMKPQKTSAYDGRKSHGNTNKVKNPEREPKPEDKSAAAARCRRIPQPGRDKKALPDESPDRALFTRSMGTTPIPIMHKRESGSPETGFPAQVAVAAYAGTSISFSAFSVRCSFRKALTRPIRFLQPSDISSSCVW